MSTKTFNKKEGRNKSMKNFKLENFNSIKEEEIEWLWKPYIPLGKLTMFAGDPSVGKSFISTFLASTISNGGKFPFSDENIESGKVVILNAEDGNADCIKKRLRLSNANFENVYTLSSIDNKKFFTLKNLSDLEEMIKEIKPKLIIIDPITSYYGENVDTFKDSAVRAILAPVVELASKYKVALLGILHFNKSNDKAIYKMNGSIANMGLPRSVIYAVHSNNDDERLLIHIKSSNAELGESIAYRITDNGVEWLGRRGKINADEVISNEESNQYETACDFILNYLKDGKQPGSKLLEDALGNGIAKRTLERARANLKKNNIIDNATIDCKTYWYIVDKRKLDNNVENETNLNDINPFDDI